MSPIVKSPIKPYPYQVLAVDMIWQWMDKNKGNPCLVLPTGAGKSVITAMICAEAVERWPGTRILMLTHVKELIEQNAEKVRLVWPNVPLGIASASIGRMETEDPIVFGGVQTLRDKAGALGLRHLIIVDEAHMINPKDAGSYRKLIADLKAVNPYLRVVGLTATPYRLGHGYIHEGEDAIFDDLIEPVSIPFLQARGFLADLRSKDTSTHFDLTAVSKRGGEFVEKELQKAVDQSLKNQEVVQEIIKKAGDRKAWLIFCTGVEHAHHIAELLLESGIPTAVVTGATSKGERETILADFKAGKIRAVTNVSVLTTGFDYPDIDLIAFLRPTLSPGLYYQMAGRGLRKKSHTDHCLILDFAGLVSIHGPITAIKAPKKYGSGDGVAPSKVCPDCDEIIPASARICPSCGRAFEPREKEWKLHQDDIMGRDLDFEIRLRSWEWRVETSKNSGLEMVTVTYYPESLTDPKIKEYFCVYHPGHVGARAQKELLAVAKNAGCLTLETEAMTAAAYPERLRVTREGKFFRVKERFWAEVPF